MKIRIKISKSSNRTASKPKNWTTQRAADDEVFDMGSLQDQDILLWANDSTSSVASSVTAPPSQTASFYKRVLKQDFASSDSGSWYTDDDDDDLDNTTLRSDDNDNCSFDESLSKTSRDGAGDPSSVAAVQKKKKKKGGLWRIRHKKKFGDGSIQELKDEDEKDHSRSNRGRSLFHDSNDTLSVAQGSEAPTVTRVKTSRRGSIGGVSSSKSISSSDDDKLAQDLGYEDAEPSARKAAPKRRGSLGALFVRPEEEVPKSEQRRRRHSLVASGTSTTTMGASSAATSSRSKQTKWISSRLLGKENAVALKDKDMYWLINQERMARKMKPFARDFVLDTLAKSMASEIVVGMQPTSNEYHGNVGCGKSLEHIHKSIMADLKGSSRKNILSETFSDFGVAVIVGRDRQHYMVTLFR